MAVCGTENGLELLGAQSQNALSPFIPLGSLQTDALPTLPHPRMLYCHLPEKCANNYAKPGGIEVTVPLELCSALFAQM